MSDSPGNPQDRPKPAARKSWQAPKGTRDFYPEDLLRRRYIIDSWRRTALRHGFEEIDGPTFEDAELYTVKSGEGILGELFGAFSGKSPEEVEQVKSGRPPFALRPEFTPTLARMYAAKARQLVQPTKWFCVSNFFRAERPQRGRLREFWQWNVDVLGDAGAVGRPGTLVGDIEVIDCAASALSDFGLPSEACGVKLNDRAAFEQIFADAGLPRDRTPALFALLDQAEKLGVDEFVRRAFTMEIPRSIALWFAKSLGPMTSEAGSALSEEILATTQKLFRRWEESIVPIIAALSRIGVSGDQVQAKATIVRGLAYYTGTVFELIAEGERAVAGGGRYDKLIELFGGLPTPAVGFGMGDVVLTNLLDDRKLMPEGRDLLEACARPLPMRCDVFVIANEKEESQAQVVPLVARLRRGVESQKAGQGECKPWSPDRYAVAPLHARRSYKTTKNIGKLLGDATACHARFACIIENAETCTLKNLDTREEMKDKPIADVGTIVASAVR